MRVLADEIIAGDAEELTDPLPADGDDALSDPLVGRELVETVEPDVEDDITDPLSVMEEDSDESKEFEDSEETEDSDDTKDSDELEASRERDELEDSMDADDSEDSEELRAGWLLIEEDNDDAEDALIDTLDDDAISPVAAYANGDDCKNMLIPTNDANDLRSVLRSIYPLNGCFVGWCM